MFVVAGAGVVATAVGLLLPYDAGEDDEPSDGDAWLRLGPGWVSVGHTW
jgi:hypothetical protein